MNQVSLSFLRSWMISCGFLALLLAGINVLTDPYLMFHTPRVTGFNAHKPAAGDREQMMKAYDVIRAAPNSALLGASRVDWGMDVHDPAWPVDAQPVYNLAIIGQGPFTALRYLQHLLGVHQVKMVLVGLDFEMFTDIAQDNASGRAEMGRRLTVMENGAENPAREREYWRDLLLSTFSFDSFSDSLGTIVANSSGGSWDLIDGDLTDSPLRKYFSLYGAYPFVELSDLSMIRRYRGQSVSGAALESLGQILRLCGERGIPVVLFIDPVYADQLEVLDRAGDWAAFEGWKRELVALVESADRFGSRRGNVLWDFSGYDTYSTETMSREGGVLHWFWDPSHYTRALGSLMIERMFGGGPAGFGCILNSGNIEMHLADIRRQQQDYREHRLADVLRVQHLSEYVRGGSPAPESQ